MIRVCVQCRRTEWLRHKVAWELPIGSKREGNYEKPLVNYSEQKVNETDIFHTKDQPIPFHSHSQAPDRGSSFSILFLSLSPAAILSYHPILLATQVPFISVIDSGTCSCLRVIKIDTFFFKKKKTKRWYLHKYKWDICQRGHLSRSLPSEQQSIANNSEVHPECRLMHSHPARLTRPVKRKSHSPHRFHMLSHGLHSFALLSVFQNFQSWQYSTATGTVHCKGS